MLTSTLRLQRITNGPLYITLRLKIMKTYFNCSQKRVSIFLREIILRWLRPAIRSHLRLLPLKRTRTSVSVRVLQPLIKYETQSRKAVFITRFLLGPLFLLSRSSARGRFKRDVVLTVECRAKESQDVTNDEMQGRIVACLTFRRHFTRGSVYGWGDATSVIS